MGWGQGKLYRTLVFLRPSLRQIWNDNSTCAMVPDDNDQSDDIIRVNWELPVSWTKKYPQKTKTKRPSEKKEMKEKIRRRSNSSGVACSSLKWRKRSATFSITLSIRVAGVGWLSDGAKETLRPFGEHLFEIFWQNRVCWGFLTIRFPCYPTSCHTDEHGWLCASTLRILMLRKNWLRTTTLFKENLLLAFVFSRWLSSIWFGSTWFGINLICRFGSTSPPGRKGKALYSLARWTSGINI